MAGVRRVIRCAGITLMLGALSSAVAMAGTTTERPSSILIFPKIIYDANHDTFIQVSNTNNSMVHAHCFYVNAAGICRLRPSEACRTDDDCSLNGPCDPQWQEVDFDIWLTKQQPTHWAAGFGRFTSPLDPACDRNKGVYDCDGAVIDPGRIPPVGDPFYGELKCIEVDASGAPLSGNHLKGEVTIVTAAGDASKYNAIGLLGEPVTNDGNTVLCLGGEGRDECPSGAEYEGCAETLIVDHFAERADSPFLGPTSQVRTEVTLVPCAEDFETQVPTKVVVQFEITNEFEQPFSTSTTVDCWGNFLLDDINLIFDVSRLGARVVQTHMRPARGAKSGIVGVIEEYHTLGDLGAHAAFNLHERGERASTDLIVIPEGP